MPNFFWVRGEMPNGLTKLASLQSTYLWRAWSVSTDQTRNLHLQKPEKPAEHAELPVHAATRVGEHRLFGPTRLIKSACKSSRAEMAN